MISVVHYKFGNLITNIPLWHHLSRISFQTFLIIWKINTARQVHRDFNIRFTFRIIHTVEYGCWTYRRDYVGIAMIKMLEFFDEWRKRG